MIDPTTLSLLLCRAAIFFLLYLSSNSLSSTFSLFISSIAPFPCSVDLVFVLKPNYFLCSLGSSKSLSAPRVGLPFVYHRFDLHPMTKYNNRYNPTALVIHPLHPAVVCFSPTPLAYPIGGPLGFVPRKMQTNHAGPVTSTNFETVNQSV